MFLNDSLSLDLRRKIPMLNLHSKTIEFHIDIYYSFVFVIVFVSMAAQPTQNTHTHTTKHANTRVNLSQKCVWCVCVCERDAFYGNGTVKATHAWPYHTAVQTFARVLAIVSLQLRCIDVSSMTVASYCSEYIRNFPQSRFVWADSSLRNSMSLTECFHQSKSR